MDQLTTWKDLLAMATGIAGFLFSLFNYRRTSRQEREALLESVILERQQVLAETLAMRSLWTTRSALLKVYGASDEQFASIERSQMSVISLCDSLLKFEVAQVRTKEELAAFRLKWKPVLAEMRSKEEVISQSFAVLIDKLKSQHKPRPPSDA